MSVSTILSRALSAIVTLLGVMVIVFVLVRVVPGDPISMMIAPGASESDINALRARYGLDLPVWQQFLVWFGQVLHGNFGTSISLKQNVMTIILERLPANARTGSTGTRHGVGVGHIHRARLHPLAGHLDPALH